MIQINSTTTYIDKEGSLKSGDIEVKQKKENKKNTDRIIKNMNVGYYLAVPLLVGVFLGQWIDKVFDTKPVFTLTLIIIGMIAAFYNLYKILKDG